MIDSDRFRGCLLGLALGDAMGAPFEGGVLERLVWRFLGRTRAGEMRWTDDTQMALDVAESLVDRGRVDADDLARRFGASYRWDRGYGPGAAKVLKRLRRGEKWRLVNRSVFPQGSFGNGGAMRAPVVGLFHARSREELESAVRVSARITHAHEHGEEGAVLIAVATAQACRDASQSAILRDVARHACSEVFRERLQRGARWLEQAELPSVDEVRGRLGNGVAAVDSCVTAIYVALRFRDEPFTGLQEFLVEVGGDVDTIGAMAGAIWGAANGARALPAEALAKLEQCERIVGVADALHRRTEGATRILAQVPLAAAFSPRVS